MPLDLVDSIRNEAVEQETTSSTPIDLVLKHIIPQGVEVPMPESIFELSGIPVFTKKSISTLIGKAKSGKTTATSWIVAQCIQQGMVVLWLDTEQGEYYGSRTQSWILNIAGMSLCPNLHYLDVRVFNPVERFSMLEQAIAHFNPDLVVIDGIRDLVFDINNPEEATIMSGNMMRVAQQYECHVLSVLHTNKGNDNARGHLGTEMINKSETVISVCTDDYKNVVCSPEFTRSEPFQEFAFQRDTYGIPQLIQDYMGHVEVGVGRRSVQPADFTLDEHRDMLSTVFNNVVELSYGELQSAVIAGYGLHGISFGVSKSKSFISHLVQQNLIMGEKDWNKTLYKLVL
ncbi:AAA family ATPase [Sphingobacterium sp. UT-1RO-CII-1]|uniref:AAA family ATPase n=1 Tax=Sphingobacterium sp. UT-1RO-CII-1 TaxID=2995225 RepID=UPI00227CCF89|nr:AAA family ATPase [Sphingobacterium sp. UT-1RO-CII-1]MCY4781691.1 AAA family ATPase [Sphingobacterium sp. UT-1RO-CII-1]